MCVIAIKSAGVESPARGILENCFKSNPDGAGFMYARGGRVHIEKGFFTFQDFMEAVDKASIKQSEAAVYHFRIATEGGLTVSNCHPFTLSGKSFKRKVCRLGIAHNGIIHDCGDIPYGYSDTRAFLKNCLSGIPGVERLLFKSEAFRELVASAIGSKLAVLNGSGDIVRIGEGFIIDTDTGLIFSNRSYKRSPWVWDNFEYGAYAQAVSNGSVKEYLKEVAPLSV